ncbi:MAG: hypothetical protein QME94_08045 [Anaerolineae bacterium]|nr:hypothetical protein [Anaerolineae bacterium]
MSSREQMSEQAQQAEERLRQQGQRVQYQARQGAENVRQTVASGLHQAAERLRQQGAAMERPTLVSRVAEPLDRGAQYLGSRSLPQIGEDVTRTAREHPVWTAAGVFAAAFLLGRILRRR